MPQKLHIIDNTITKTLDGFEMLDSYEMKRNLLLQVVRSELMNLRGGNAHTKTRAEVRGGGRKPWKQKGTGRARHGSRRSPIWVGGGVTFGPRNLVNWHCNINKSSRITALKSILKDRFNENLVFAFKDEFDFPRTKDAVDTLAILTAKSGFASKRSIILYTTEEKEKIRGFSSTDAKLMNAGNIKIVNLVNAAQIIFTPKAKELLETRITK
jgi:large subunit ribosomal protein L4